MLRRRTFALLVAVALLAFPATSLAQSAGDNQYQDPLAGSGGGSGSSGHSGSAGNSGGSSGSSTPSTPSNAPTAAAPSSSAGTGTGTSADPPASGAQAPGRQLPRTGFDVILTVELGLAMLLVGLVSHRMLVLRERR